MCEIHCPVGLEILLSYMFSSFTQHRLRKDTFSRQRFKKIGRAVHCVWSLFLQNILKEITFWFGLLRLFIRA